MVCKQPFRHWTFADASRSPISSCESSISDSWAVTIRQFYPVLFQIHYIQQKFYREINFLSLSDICCKTHFLLERVLSFSGGKVRTTVECWKLNGFIPRGGNRMQKYSPGRTFWLPVFYLYIYFRMMLWTDIQKEEYWLQNSSKRLYTHIIYFILQECIFSMNKSSGSTWLHSVSISESQSEQMDPSHTISAMIFSRK